MKTKIYNALKEFNEIIKNDIHYRLDGIIDILCQDYIIDLIAEGRYNGILLENNDFILTEDEVKYLQLEQAKNKHSYGITEVQLDGLLNVLHNIRRNCNCIYSKKKY